MLFPIVAVGLGLFLYMRNSMGLLPGIQTAKDVQFGTDPKQAFDVYFPEHQTTGAPIIFFVHGGAWRFGDKGSKKVIKNKVNYWVGQKGYVFVSTNYRLKDVSPLEQADDVARALGFLQAHAQSWGADPNKIVVMGHSAGAHLASLVTTAEEIQKAHAVKPWKGTVSIDSQFYDLEPVMLEPHQEILDEVFGADRNFWRAVSPVRRMGKMKTPFLAICSTEREGSGSTCPPTDVFIAEVLNRGGTAARVGIAKSHEQLNDHLGKPEAYTEHVDAFLRSLGLPYSLT